MVSTPSLESIILSNMDMTFVSNHFLTKLLFISPSYPAINMTDITIPSDFYIDQEVNTMDFGWFPELTTLSIGKNCFQHVNEVIFTNNTLLQSIVIDDLSFLSTSSVSISSSEF